MKIRLFIGILFLSLQMISIGYARFIPERYFCWAPYDIHTKFEVFVTIDGKLLTNEEARQRYRYKMKGWEQRSIYNVMALITQYESTYGKRENADVQIIYSINGHPEKLWKLEK